MRCSDVAASAAFYREVLGLDVAPLEGFAFAIEEVSTAGQMFLHLFQAGTGLDELLEDVRTRPRNTRTSRSPPEGDTDDRRPPSP